MIAVHYYCTQVRLRGLIKLAGCSMLDTGYAHKISYYTEAILPLSNSSQPLQDKGSNLLTRQKVNRVSVASTYGLC